MARPEIVVLDRRKGKLRDDGSNVADAGVLVTIHGCDVLIVIDPDGVFVERGSGRVALVQPKSEAQMSAEKAVADRELRAAKAFVPATTSAMEKATAVWDVHD